MGENYDSTNMNCKTQPQRVNTLNILKKARYSHWLNFHTEKKNYLWEPILKSRSFEQVTLTLNKPHEQVRINHQIHQGNNRRY